MDVVDRGNYQIEVGLSQKDITRLTMGNPEEGLVRRGILLGSQKFSIYALSEEQRDRMVPEEERMPAAITYHREPYHPETVEQRDKVYAKYFNNGDVDVYMYTLTAMAIHPDGITEINAKIPQLLAHHPDNHVKMFVKIPF